MDEINSKQYMLYLCIVVDLTSTHYNYGTDIFILLIEMMLNLIIEHYTVNKDVRVCVYVCANMCMNVCICVCVGGWV